MKKWSGISVWIWMVTLLFGTGCMTGRLAAQSGDANRAETAPGATELLFRNVRVFDGKSAKLSALTSVLVRGNKIAAVGGDTHSSAATVIDGGGRTLMPGLIDAHVHLMFDSVSLVTAITASCSGSTMQY